MRSRVARLAVVVLLTLGVVAAPTPPAAQARGTGVLVVVGVLTVGPGIAYPCVGDGFFGISPSKCLGHVSTNNWATANFAGTGTGSINYALDPKCSTPWCGEAGLYGFDAAGFVRGACGLSTGEIGGAIHHLLAIPGPTAKISKNRTFAASFTELGGVVTLTGTTNKNETIAGTLTAVPTTGSCANKQGKTFTVTGSLTFTKVD